MISEHYSKEEIIKLLRKQISSTNLYDRSVYNTGYRDALRDMIMVFDIKENMDDYGK